MSFQFPPPDRADDAAEEDETPTEEDRTPWLSLGLRPQRSGPRRRIDAAMDVIPQRRR